MLSCVANKKVIKIIDYNCVSRQFLSTYKTSWNLPKRGSENNEEKEKMEIQDKEKMEILEGTGVFTNASEMEILKGMGG